jgi:multiple sugar transport system permease protein
MRATTPVVRPTPLRQRSPRRLLQRDDVWGYLFIAPQLIGFLLFAAFPIGLAVALSFAEWNFLDAPTFVGLQNVQTIIADKNNLLQYALRNTVSFVIGIVPLTMSFALLLALLLHRPTWGAQLYKVAFFLPYVTASAAVSLLWYWLLAPDLGLINSLLGRFGIQGPLWLQDPLWARPAIILYITWQSAGYAYLLFSAGLRAVPEEYYEAARIDGANAFDQFRHITLPLLSPTTFFLLTTLMIGCFNLFGEVYILTRGQGGPVYSTYTIVLYIYQLAFGFFRMGEAAVVSWLLFGILFALTALNFWFSRRWVHFVE